MMARKLSAEAQTYAKAIGATHVDTRFHTLYKQDSNGDFIKLFLDGTELVAFGSWVDATEYLIRIDSGSSDTKCYCDKYSYEQLPLSTEDIAKLLIEGEILYNEKRDHHYLWNGEAFINDEGDSVLLRGTFYRRVELKGEQLLNDAD